MGHGVASIRRAILNCQAGRLKNFGKPVTALAGLVYRRIFLDRFGPPNKSVYAVTLVRATYFLGLESCMDSVGVLCVVKYHLGRVTLVLRQIRPRHYWKHIGLEADLYWCLLHTSLPHTVCACFVAR